ncbi:hypothetical protein CAOG_007085 [Capsaspora owczarzaki ATCC 30864]|uniref:Caspase family p20 domain-containing protein n=1 Tax=Capsaspora owczarzaki (strain ATCC 30864) TaxID=595528 RepID=A0A0D2X4X5_CAPO3|nr:hypothetical protein CAOG_007085 [Capsaspora owczarzaki ATCC 30864]
MASPRIRLAMLPVAALLVVCLLLLVTPSHAAYPAWMPEFVSPALIEKATYKSNPTNWTMAHNFETVRLAGGLYEQDRAVIDDLLVEHPASSEQAVQCVASVLTFEQVAETMTSIYADWIAAVSSAVSAHADNPVAAKAAVAALLPLRADICLDVNTFTGLVLDAPVALPNDLTLALLYQLPSEIRVINLRAEALPVNFGRIAGNSHGILIQPTFQGLPNSHAGDVLQAVPAVGGFPDGAGSATAAARIVFSHLAFTDCPSVCILANNNTVTDAVLSESVLSFNSALADAALSIEVPNTAGDVVTVVLPTTAPGSSRTLPPALEVFIRGCEFGLDGGSGVHASDVWRGVLVEDSFFSLLGAGVPRVLTTATFALTFGKWPVATLERSAHWADQAPLHVVVRNSEFFGVAGLVANAPVHTLVRDSTFAASGVFQSGISLTVANCAFSDTKTLPTLPSNGIEAWGYSHVFILNSTFTDLVVRNAHLALPPDSFERVYRSPVSIKTQDHMLTIIDECVFTRCTAWEDLSYGGGVSLSPRGDAISGIFNTRFESTSAQHGGAIRLGEPHRRSFYTKDFILPLVTVSNCVFESVRGYSAIFSTDRFELRTINCQFLNTLMRGSAEFELRAIVHIQFQGVFFRPLTYVSYDDVISGTTYAPPAGQIAVAGDVGFRNVLVQWGMPNRYTSVGVTGAKDFAPSVVIKIPEFWPFAPKIASNDQGFPPAVLAKNSASVQTRDEFCQRCLTFFQCDTAGCGDPAIERIVASAASASAAAASASAARTRPHSYPPVKPASLVVPVPLPSGAVFVFNTPADSASANQALSRASPTFAPVITRRIPRNRTIVLPEEQAAQQQQQLNVQLNAQTSSQTNAAAAELLHSNTAQYTLVIGIACAAVVVTTTGFLLKRRFAKSSSRPGPAGKRILPKPPKAATAPTAEGGNPLVATAFTSLSVASSSAAAHEPAIMDPPVQPAKPELSVNGSTSSLAMPLPPVSKRDVFISIGADKYQHLPCLALAKADADSMARQFEDFNEYTVVKIADPTKDVMEQVLSRNWSMPKRPDTIVVFFAGHGVIRDGVTYLVPCDAKLTPDNIPETCISTQQVLELLGSSKPRNIVLLLDACREQPEGSGAAPLALQESLKKSSYGTLISFATIPGEFAFEGHRTNSHYTSALLAQLRSDPPKTISDVLQNVRSRVLNLSSGKQSPYYISTLTEEAPIYFHNPQHRSQSSQTAAAAVAARYPSAGASVAAHPSAAAAGQPVLVPVYSSHMSVNSAHAAYRGQQYVSASSWNYDPFAQQLNPQSFAYAFGPFGPPPQPPVPPTAPHHQRHPAFLARDTICSSRGSPSLPSPSLPSPGESISRFCRLNEWNLKALGYFDASKSEPLSASAAVDSAAQQQGELC